MNVLLPLALALVAAVGVQRRQKQPPQQRPPPASSVTCYPDRIEVSGEPTMAVGNPIAAALDRAGPGTKILVTAGDYPAFSIGFNKPKASNARTSGGLSSSPVIVEGNGQVRIRPGQESDTIAISQQIPNGHITFKNLQIECGSRAGVMFFADKAGAQEYAGYRFHDCDLIGGYDHATQQGARAKWGVWGKGLREFEFRGVQRRAQVSDIRAEHGFYLQNPRGDITIENVDAKRLGRTFCQFTARAGDGPPGIGTITVRNCRVSDCGLFAGDNYKGGSAFTFAGRLTGTIVVERNTYRAGFDRSLLHLTRPESPYGTGALVAWDGGAGAPNGKLVLRDNDFEFAPGCGDRPVVSLGGCREVQLVGSNRFFAGAHPSALEFDPVDELGKMRNSALGAVKLERAPQLRGEVRHGGELVTPERLSQMAAERDEAK